MGTILGVDPYASKVLVPSVHGRLVADLKFYAADTGITPDRLWTSMKSQKDLTDIEVNYITSFRRQSLNGKAGLVFVGDDPHRDITEAMSLMAAALVRNFIRARVMTLPEVLQYAEEHGYPEHTALMIPDFHFEALKVGAVSKHKVSRLVGLLLSRYQHGLQTVIYVSDMDRLAMDYGRMIARHIEKNFVRVDVG
ncbi:hypothetical protein ASG52_24290 [Methylobacterium sp. Leaf456]|uniref:hypothetical protein n=1 Tax=Methylobacterium sp. Leaf456 TaxID=1736382 RepID=UPI00070071D9|nr:hypothetical protein [Methylobacterium sp. Leaf456]KQT56124.1 hypothetical protein ASG52_24290 [Methylobacterium sp. Leaf456]